MNLQSDQTFLTNELRRAVASTDQQWEVNLVLLHYHQSALTALQDLQLCTSCACKVGATFKAQVAQIQQTAYRNYCELDQAYNTHLQAIICLCTTCQQSFEQEALRQFRQRRQQREQ